MLCLANDDVLRNYWNAEQKCRRLTKIMGTYIPINQTMLILPLFISFYNLYVGNVDTSTWILPFTIYVPFRTDHIVGWYFYWFTQLNMGFGYSISISTSTSYFVCCSVYIIAICDHFVAIIRSIKDDIERNHREKNKVEYLERRKRIKENLIKSVDIHVKIFE